MSGYLNTVTTDGRAWYDGDAPIGPPWLKISVIDGDVGVIEYSPRFGGSGIAYAGVSLATYYEDESIPATDRSREVAALAAWFEAVGLRVSADGLYDLIVDNGQISDEPFVEDSLKEFFAATALGEPPAQEEGSP